MGIECWMTLKRKPILDIPASDVYEGLQNLEVWKWEQKEVCKFLTDTIYIRSKQDEKLIEEGTGRKKQCMTSAKANQLRDDLMAGKSEMNDVKKREASF